MKILFLVAEFPKLSETFVLNQIIHLEKGGHTVFVAALGNPQEKVIHPQSKKILSRVVYPPFWAKKFVRPLYFAFKFRNKKIDVIHAHFGFAGKVGVTLKKFLKCPLVTSFYGIDASPSRTSKDYYKELFSEGDLFLVLSKDMEKDLIQLGCPVEKIKVQHVGVDFGEISKLKKSASGDSSNLQNSKFSSKLKTILSVGRLVEKKGFDDLVKAFNLVLGEVPQVELGIIGGGPMENGLKGLVNKLGLGGRVKFLGPQTYDFVLKELWGADVFALASKTALNGDKEGTPVVLMDAQAVGVPVVSTRHAGIPEVVLDGKTGVLVEEEDIDGFSGALIKILRDPELAQSFGERGRRYIEKNYNIERQVKKLVEVYRELKK